MADRYTPSTSSRDIDKLIQESTNLAAKNRVDNSQTKAEQGRGKLLNTQKDLNKAVKDEVNLIKEQVEQVKKLNEYSKANLASKSKILEKEASILKSKKDELVAVAKGIKDDQVRVALLEKANELEKEIEQKTRMATRQQEELKRVLYENGSVKEKIAAQEADRAEKLKKQKEEELKIQEKIAEARAKDDKESEKKYLKELEDAKEQHKKENNSNTFASLKADLGGLFSKNGAREFGSNVIEGLSEGDKLGTAVGSAFKVGAPSVANALGPKFQLIVGAIKAVASLVSKLQDTLDKGVDKAIEVQTSYLGKINSRLQGSGESFAKFQNDMGASFGKSAFISQQNLMKTIADMVDKGIAFNVEQRAIFQELKDSMVSTFDSFAGELPRLIRLQQTDITAGQMGFESLLTQFLNTNFQDTSYLSDVYDNISSALIDASSQLSAQQASEFNYAVQKWLGSLYSVGMSQEGVSRIAKGVEYLATGNVEALNADDSLRTLFAAASGGAYSSILTGGLNAATVNELLGSVVEYLKGISQDTNQVTKQALSGAFGGLSFSDLRALSNMSDEIVASIYSTNKSYADAMQETLNQLTYATTVYDYRDLSNISTNARVSPSQLIENAYQNILYEYGAGIAGDFGRYKTHRIGALLENKGGLIGKLAGGILKLINNIGMDLSSDSTGGIESLINMIDVEFSSVDRFRDLFMGSGLISPIIKDLKDRTVNRGGVATSSMLADGNTISGFSMMSRLNLGTNTGGLTDFSSTTAATAAQTTTTGEEVSRGVSDLYSELFERQTTAMKVSVSSFDGIAASTLANVINANVRSSVGIQNISDDALKALSQTMRAETLDDINEKLSGTIQVSSQEDFMSTINNGLAYVRGV
jgi:hypothetical protein